MFLNSSKHHDWLTSLFFELNIKDLSASAHGILNVSSGIIILMESGPDALDPDAVGSCLEMIAVGLFLCLLCPGPQVGGFVLPCAPHQVVQPHLRPNSKETNQFWTKKSKP